MSVSLTPDTYSPNVDSNGNYVDHSPIIKNGIYCVCGASKDKIYETNSKFKTHTKTQRHQKWLKELNDNKSNYFIECQKLNETVKQQRIQIAELNNNLSEKKTLLNFVTQQIKTLDMRKTQNLIDV
jgi:hypothetical protein